MGTARQVALSLLNMGSEITSESYNFFGADYCVNYFRYHVLGPAKEGENFISVVMECKSTDNCNVQDRDMDSSQLIEELYTREVEEEDVSDDEEISVVSDDSDCDDDFDSVQISNEEKKFIIS